MSPILTRPVREQFEHDRVIRLLQARYKRKFDVAMNPGAEQNASVPSGELAMYPDLILYSQERGRKLQGTVEVETSESVNTLEAMAEWGPFSRMRVPFYLYVPPNSLDTARRLCAEHQVSVAEIWTFHTAVDQVRFTMVHRAPETRSTKDTRVTKDTKIITKDAKAAKPARAVAKPAKKAAPKKPARTSKPAKKVAAKKSAKAAKRR